MKNLLIFIFQKILGLRRYLFITSILKIFRKNLEPMNKDFFYFLNLLDDKFNVLDIGANVGVMTYFLSKRVIKGKVFAFEPILESYNNINRLIKFYKLNNIKSFNCALGNEEKIISMNMPIIHNYKAHTFSYVMQNEYYFGTNNVIKYEVMQKRLDDFNELKDLKINAIKIDVENYEYFVFLGGNDLIRRNMPLIYTELWLGSDNQIKCFDLLLSFGYQKPKILVGDTLVEFDPKIHYSSNFFFIPK